MNVLLVEDEKRIADFARKGLASQGFDVTVSHDGHEAYDLIRNHAWDVVVLDIMLPGRDGLSILKNLRKQGNPVPVILLTARSELDERLEGLDLGADDYMTKPFYVEELVARVHAITRRSGGKALSILEGDGLTVNLLQREVTRDDIPVTLTSREFSLLEYLMRAPGRVYTRTQILEHVWGYDFDPDTNLIDVHIQRLRKKLDADHRNRYIETIRGVGYRFRKAEG